MIALVKAFFKDFDFSPEEFSLIIARSKFQHIEKGKQIIKRDLFCKEIHIITEGLFRLCLPKENNELKTIMIYQAGEVITDYRAFIQKTPATFVAVALKDSAVITLTYQDIHELYELVPRFNSFARKLTEQQLINTIDELTMFYAMPDPVKRYDAFINKFKNIAAYIPQHMIADIINVTPVHLSRAKANYFRRYKSNTVN